MWSAPMKNSPDRFCQCQTTYSAVDSCLVFIGLDNKVWKTNIKQFIHLTNRDLSSVWNHNILAPPPHAGHQVGYTLLWDGIPFFNQRLFQVGQCICVTLARTARPTRFHKCSVGLRLGLQAGHSLHSQIWPNDSVAKGRIWTHCWSQGFSTCSGSSAHVFDASTNGPEGEGQSWQAWQPYETGDWLRGAAVASTQLYRPAHLNLKYVRADRLSKQSSSGVVFLGHQLWNVSLTSPHFIELGLQFGDGAKAHSK